MVEVSGAEEVQGRQPDVEPDPVTGEIVAALFRLVDELKAHFDQVAARFGLTTTQALALRDLDRPLAMARLAGTLRCEPSNVTAMAGRLEARGLVERRPLATDRRVRQLVLTAAGRRLRAEFVAALFTGVPAVAGLTKAQRQQLHDLLTQVTATVDASHHGPTTPASKPDPAASGGPEIGTATE
jgi:MarR family transcriptional regulator, organic hydroperoxide resistance regulator